MHVCVRKLVQLTRAFFGAPPGESSSPRFGVVVSVLRGMLLVPLCRVFGPAAQILRPSPDNLAERGSRKSWIARPEYVRCAVRSIWEGFRRVSKYLGRLAHPTGR